MTKMGVLNNKRYRLIINRDYNNPIYFRSIEYFLFAVKKNTRWI